jgi:predicted metalloendopeptidase
LGSGIDLAAADATVRIQDDLFRHVNGTWLANTEIPADRSSWGAFVRLAEKSQNDLRAIAEEAAKSQTKTPGSDAQKIGDFYDSFMNEAKAEQLGMSPLDAELAAINAIRTKEELARHFARFFKMNLTNPLIGYVDGDAGQPDHEILYVYQGGLGMPDRDYYLKDDARLKEYREKYVSFVEDVLKLGGQSNPGAGAREIFVLETRLARAHWTNVESRDAVKIYNKIATADLARQFPGFDWATWMKELGVSGASSFVVNQPSYVKAFAAAVNEMPVERWKPYLKASLINGFSPYLSKAFVDTEFDFYSRTLRGVKEIEPRWKRAVNTINSNMGEMLGKLYVERHFTPQPRRGWSSWWRTSARPIAAASTGSSGWGRKRRRRPRKSWPSSGRRSAIRTSGAIIRSSRSRRTISSAT